jgi:hypothetical protein
MTHRYIIDTNILIRYPEVLTRVGDEIKLVLPQAVLDEISRGSSTGRWLELKALVQEAISRGVEVMQSPRNVALYLHPASRAAQRISGADIDIARIAFDLANKFGNESVSVITADKDLIHFLESRHISAFGAPQFIAETSTQEANQALQKSVVKLSSSQRRFTIISFAMGIVASLIGNVIFSYHNQLLSTIPVWGTILALPLIGIGLFWYRERYRLSYGVFEFAVGVFMAYYIFLPDFDYSKLGTLHAIQVLGGLYVMVRGMDNIGKGIDGTKFSAYWKRLF